mgnify:CR=1 FL=1
MIAECRQKKSCFTFNAHLLIRMHVTGGHEMSKIIVCGVFYYNCCAFVLFLKSFEVENSFVRVLKNY